MLRLPGFALLTRMHARIHPCLMSLQRGTTPSYVLYERMWWEL